VNQLFRPQAVEHSRKRLEGKVLLAVPLSVTMLGAVFCTIVVTAGVFLCVGTYSRKETVAGWITPQSGIIRVTTPHGGVVERLGFREGETASLGAAMATLRLTSSIDGKDIGESVAQSIVLERQAGEIQLEAGQKKLRAQLASLKIQRAGLAEELEEGVSRLATNREREALSKAAVDRYQSLRDRGIVTETALESMRAAYLAAIQATSQARSANLSTQRAIGDIDRQLAQLPADEAGLEAQASQVRASLAQKAIGAYAQSSYVAEAPITGQVVALPVEIGQAVPPGATLAVMAPAGSTLMADLYVPSRAAGFIRPGQRVNLMYQAFPYQKFGVGRGRVQSVSRTVLGPGETAIPGLEMKEPVFRVRVQLDSAVVSAYGQTLPLQPGMLLTADIVIDRRSLAEWLLDPIYAAKRRAA
jgi:membrane fusion protein